jgi:Ethanolamine utilization protein EutJ (predicted chaperonin)
MTSDPPRYGPQATPSTVVVAVCGVDVVAVALGVTGVAVAPAEDVVVGAAAATGGFWMAAKKAGSAAVSRSTTSSVSP